EDPGERRLLARGGRGGGHAGAARQPPVRPHQAGRLPQRSRAHRRRLQHALRLADPRQGPAERPEAARRPAGAFPVPRDAASHPGDEFLTKEAEGSGSGSTPGLESSGQESTMSPFTGSGPARIGAMVRQSFAAMTRQERRRVLAMYGVTAGLHVLVFFVFFVFVVPSHYKGLGIGVSILAYTLGLRHAFHAHHISEIDNTIRKVLNERRGTGRPRPFAFGFFFSLGHSTVVVAIGIG